MVLPSLATPEDAARFGYDLGDTAEQYLARASSRLRRAAGQPITSRTSTVRLLAGRDGVVLPSPPVTAVTSVVAMACDGTETPVTDWCWDGETRIGGVCSGSVLVTYTHGYATVPDELAELTCSVAHRLQETPLGMAGGVRTRAIDDFSETYAAEAVSTAGGLLPGELAALAEFLPTGDAVMVEAR